MYKEPNDGVQQAEKALALLLATVFDSAGLRRWIRYNLGAAVYQELPGPSVSMDALIFESVLAIQRHGAATRALFLALLNDRPRHADAIESVAYLFGVSLRTI